MCERTKVFGVYIAEPSSEAPEQQRRSFVQRFIVR
jgi:hypothetical protein